jgi:probable phosphoglycerate mutase
MRIIGLRHGQSEFNLLGLCNDDPAREVDLTALGREQAAQAGELLAGGSPRAVDRSNRPPLLRARRAAAQEDPGALGPIDAIFCSPLLRAHQTALIVADRLGLPLQVEPRLSDIRSGFDGRPVTDYLAAIAHDPVDVRAGGESLRDYARRVGGFLDELACTPAETVLLVAHEETLRVIEARCLGLELAAVAGKAYENCRPYCFKLQEPGSTPSPPGRGPG